MSLCEQGTDEPVQPHNLISASVVHCLDTCTISPTFAKPEISRLRLVFVAEQADLSTNWLHTYDNRFSHDVIQIILGIVISWIFTVPCLLTLGVPVATQSPPSTIRPLVCSSGGSLCFSLTISGRCIGSCD